MGKQRKKEPTMPSSSLRRDCQFIFYQVNGRVAECLKRGPSVLLELRKRFGDKAIDILEEKGEVFL